MIIIIIKEEKKSQKRTVKGMGVEGGGMKDQGYVTFRYIRRLCLQTTLFDTIESQQIPKLLTPRDEKRNSI